VLAFEALRIILLSSMLAFDLLLTASGVLLHLSYPLLSGD